MHENVLRTIIPLRNLHYAVNISMWWRRGFICYRILVNLFMTIYKIFISYSESAIISPLIAGELSN